MKKLFLILALLFISANLSFAQTKWFTIEYSYSSGPVSPEYQKTYTTTIGWDRSGQISYHKGMDKRAPTQETFTVTKSNFKKLNKAIVKTGVLNGTAVEDKPDGMIGGPVQSITITYGPSDPNLDQPVRKITFNKTANSSKDVEKLFDMMDKMVPNKIWKSLGD